MLEPLVDTLANVRATARQIARETVKADLARVSVSASVPMRAEVLALDAERAEFVANAYVDDWLSRATVGVKAAETDAEARAALSDATDENAWRIERDSVTETYQAYNVEVEEVTDDIAGTLTQAQAEHLVRVWIAEGDHPCATCDSYNGDEVPFGEDFSGGIPGDIHANCRCIESIEWRD